jgi:hypothetical protein
MPIASIQYDSDFYIESLKRYRRQHGGRHFGLIVKVLGVLILTPVAVSLFWQGLFLWGLLITALVILAFFSQYIDYWMIRRAFRKSPFRDELVTIEFTEPGFHATSPIQDIKLQWPAFTKVVYFPDGFLLFRGPGTVNWIPFSAIPDMQQTQELENLLRAKVGNHQLIN